MADGDPNGRNWDAGNDEDRNGARFAYSPVLQAVGKLGYYDDSSVDEEFGLAPGRGQVFAFVAPIFTTGGRTFLQIAALTTPLELYTVGSGGSGSGAGIPGTQTDAESSAGKDGGIVRNEATFVSVGMMVERMPCWVTDAGATDVLAIRDDADFLGGGIPGCDYGARLQAQVEQAADFLMDVAGGTRKKCEEHLGSIADWLMNPSNMRLNLPGHFWLFSADYGSGGQSSDMELTVKTEMTRTIRVEQNAALPFLTGKQVVVPFRMRQIGYTLCGDPENLKGSCATNKRRMYSEADVQKIASDAAEKAAGAVMRRLGK